MAGDISVAWANIETLQSSRSFAVLKAHQRLTRKDAERLVSKGQIAVTDNQITVATPAGSQTVPVADARLLVDAASFDKAINHPPSLLQGWAGTATAGATLVRATQNSTTFNGAITLVRATPTVGWLPARDRTILGYAQAYGTTSQTGVPTTKTNIFHASAERDQYISSRVFAFVSSTFDHNYSQNLDLQQAYGGGIGITLLKSAIQQLDIKGDTQYTRESFFSTPTSPAPPQNVNLFGSTFSETYSRILTKKSRVVFDQLGSFTPSYNVPSAYSAHVQGNLIFPVYRGFAFNIGAVDDFLNNAPIGSNKNSSQFTTGITYTITPRERR
jgi:hypothetical protein